MYPEKPVQKQEPYVNAVYPMPPSNAVNLSSPHSPVVAVPPSNVNYNIAPKTVDITGILSQNPKQENCLLAHDSIQNTVPRNNVDVPNKIVSKSGIPAQQNENRKIEVTSTSHAVVAADICVIKAPPSVQQNDSVKVTNGVDSAPSPKSWASLFNKTQSGINNSAAASVITNGCSKSLATVSPFTVNDTEELSEEFLAMKEALRTKYDDPSFYRMGGKQFKI